MSIRKWKFPLNKFCKKSEKIFSHTFGVAQIQSLQCDAELDLWVAQKENLISPSPQWGTKSFNFDEWDFFENNLKHDKKYESISLWQSEFKKCMVHLKMQPKMDAIIMIKLRLDLWS